jgi:hypothetical protein
MVMPFVSFVFLTLAKLTGFSQLLLLLRLQEVMMHNAQKEIVEKIVEREVIKEVRVGVSEEEMAAIHRKNEDEKRRVMKQVRSDDMCWMCMDCPAAGSRDNLSQ